MLQAKVKLPLWLPAKEMCGVAEATSTPVLNLGTRLSTPTIPRSVPLIRGEGTSDAHWTRGWAGLYVIGVCYKIVLLNFLQSVIMADMARAGQVGLS